MSKAKKLAEKLQKVSKGKNISEDRKYILDSKTKEGKYCGSIELSLEKTITNEPLIIIENNLSTRKHASLLLSNVDKLIGFLQQIKKKPVSERFDSNSLNRIFAQIDSYGDMEDFLSHLGEKFAEIVESSEGDKKVVEFRKEHEKYSKMLLEAFWNHYRG